MKVGMKFPMALQQADSCHSFLCIYDQLHCFITSLSYILLGMKNIAAVQYHQLYKRIMVCLLGLMFY